MSSKRVLQSLPHHKRLGWLQAQDLAERTEWVTKFRESTKMLGQVVMEGSAAPATPVGKVPTPRVRPSSSWGGG